MTARSGPADSASTAAAAVPAARERSIRMLLVEDSEDDAFLLYSELATHGMTLDWTRIDNAPDMAGALVQDWDVIVCDHNMPGFDSLAALEVLKRSGKDIPFIIYSGQISDQQAVAAMHDGVHDYIEKGNYVRLVPVIERELKNAAARRAVREADGRIQELAYFDTLSNLPNHNLFCTRVMELMLEREREGKPARGAAFYVDLDRFLRINSSFGYETGNEILRQIAQRLTDTLASEVQLARLSGDSFQVAIHPHGGIDRPLNKLVTRRPSLHQVLAFFLHLFLHQAEFLDNGLHALAKMRAGQVVVNHFHLGLLAFAGQARG